MTLSTSDTDRSPLKATFVALLLSIFCATFGGVYEIFSHGVWSGFMVYAFLFPLGLEAIPFCFLALLRRPMPSRWTLNLHHAGVATLTVGSFFQGALEIYGTTNRLTRVYWVAGALLLLGALFLHTFRRRA